MLYSLDHMFVSNSNWQLRVQYAESITLYLDSYSEKQWYAETNFGFNIYQLSWNSSLTHSYAIPSTHYKCNYHQTRQENIIYPYAEIDSTQHQAHKYRVGEQNKFKSEGSHVIYTQFRKILRRLKKKDLKMQKHRKRKQPAVRWTRCSH